MDPRPPPDLTDAVDAARLQTLGTLTAGVVHELNTPFGALASNHDSLKRAVARLQEILADEVVDLEELEEVRRIVRALDGVMRVNEMAMGRVRDLVGSLRSFGRPDRAEIDVLDLHEGLEAALTLLRHELGDRVRIVRDFGELPRVRCYPQRVNQVVANLLLNAVHAIPEEGTITLRTRASEDGVTLSVADTGCGIPADRLARVFEPGFTTKGERVGMGLGLSIVRQCVDLHGGRIEVDSEPGRGSTFTVHLPLSPRAEPPSNQP